jgi:hypothetical protein
MENAKEKERSGTEMKTGGGGELVESWQLKER